MSRFIQGGTTPGSNWASRLLPSDSFKTPTTKVWNFPPAIITGSIEIAFPLMNFAMNWWEDGVLNIVFPWMEVSVTEVTPSMEIDIDLPVASVSLSGTTGDICDVSITSPKFVIAFSLYLENIGSMDIDQPSMTVSTSGISGPIFDMDIIFPYPVFLLGVHPGILGSIQVERGPPEVSLSGNPGIACDIDVEQTSLDVSLSGSSGFVGTIDIQSPSAIVDFGGSNDFAIVFPTLSLDLQGGYGVVGSLTADVPLPEVSFTGMPSFLASFDIQSPIPQVSFDCFISTVGDISIDSPIPTVSLSGSTTDIGSIKITFPVISVELTGYIQTTGSFSINVPSNVVIFEGEVLVTTAHYKGSATNLVNFATTDYSGDFFFHSFAYFNGKYYGANASGIFELTGDTDNGVQINSRVKLPPVDIWGRTRRYVREAWFTGRADGRLTLVLQLDEDDIWEIDFINPTELLQENKIKIARGIRNRFISFEIKNQGGVDFDIESIRILTEEATHRGR